MSAIMRECAQRSFVGHQLCLFDDISRIMRHWSVQFKTYIILALLKLPKNQKLILLTHE